VGLQWLVAATRSRLAECDPTPWDTAHSVASANSYRHYIEPDIFHDRVARANDEIPGFDTHWPPFKQVGVSPAWHLESNFTGFSDARNTASGRGIRIAHLDTGYIPKHMGLPRNLRAEWGYDFWDEKPGAVDPCHRGPFLNPGHGTATLALLAGGKIDVEFEKQRFSGDIGGAPEAEVVPIRVSPSVIHVCTSAMARGLLYALGPACPQLGSEEPGFDPNNCCDVVSISHGGLPSEAWAYAVNELYDRGIVVVAAAGDSYWALVTDVPTHFTVYPSAFNRVLTSVGATYGKAPYSIDDLGVMQGCWGPDEVMEKAIASFTPNVIWMDYKSPNGFAMNGAGTSASTPQAAAACALWLELYRGRVPKDWTRVESCRLGLFDGADNAQHDKRHFGWGILNVPLALQECRASRAIASATTPAPADRVSFAFWRLLLGIGPPNSAEDRMYETEVSQVVLQTNNVELRKAANDVNYSGQTLSVTELATCRALLLRETISSALRRRIVR
jgi:hypothetical protein